MMTFLALIILYIHIAKADDLLVDNDVVCWTLLNNPTWTCEGSGNCVEEILVALIKCDSLTCCRTSPSTWIISPFMDITEYKDIGISFVYYRPDGDQYSCYIRYWHNNWDYWINIYTSQVDQGRYAFDSGPIAVLDQQNITRFSLGGDDACHWDTIRIYGTLITPRPTHNPTIITEIPTDAPTKYPTTVPTNIPSIIPTQSPSKITSNPTYQPTISPTEYPTETPTTYPTLFPTYNPSVYPTGIPTDYPSIFPTFFPTQLNHNPTVTPNINNTSNPTFNPTKLPSLIAIITPTRSNSTDAVDSDQPVRVNNKVLVISISIAGGLILLLGCIAIIMFFKIKQKLNIERNFADIHIDEQNSNNPTRSRIDSQSELPTKAVKTDVIAISDTNTTNQYTDDGLNVNDANYIVNSMELTNKNNNIKMEHNDDKIFGNKLTMGIIDQNVEENGVINEMATDAGDDPNNIISNDNNSSNESEINVTKGDYEVKAMEHVSYFIDKTKTIDF